MARKSLVKGFLSCLLVALVIFVIKGQIHVGEQLMTDSERSLKTNNLTDSERPLKTNGDQLVAPARKISYSQEVSLNPITEQPKILMMESHGHCL